MRISRRVTSCEAGLAKKWILMTQSDYCCLWALREYWITDVDLMKHQGINDQLKRHCSHWALREYWITDVDLNEAPGNNRISL
jgi:hypothetical protein